MLTVKDGRKQLWSEMPLQELAFGNCADSYYTLKLFDILYTKLKELQLVGHYETLLSPLNTKMAKIELEGMLIDKVKLEEMAPKLSEKCESLKKALYQFEEVSENENVSSNKDLVNIFFTKENGFGLYPPFRTKKTGNPQVDKNTLETLEAMMEEEIESRI